MSRRKDQPMKSKLRPSNIKVNHHICNNVYRRFPVGMLRKRTSLYIHNIYSLPRRQFGFTQPIRTSHEVSYLGG